MNKEEMIKKYEDYREIIDACNVRLVYLKLEK